MDRNLKGCCTYTKAAEKTVGGRCLPYYHSSAAKWKHICWVTNGHREPEGTRQTARQMGKECKYALMGHEMGRQNNGTALRTADKILFNFDVTNYSE